jgi:protein-L-isoaspartate(D-aspartate) O-methyltransferase
MRQRLVEELEEKGISDERVLSAISVVPRHFFLDPAFDKWAYQDNAFPIGHKQTISQPYTVAYQSQLLEVEEKDKSLEIGTGSGYQAAILATMGARVYSIERQEELYRQASRRLQELGFKNIRTYFGDGYKGLPRQAPFHKIIVTCGAPDIPPALKEQLKPGGLMVIPVGEGKVQKMIRLRRINEIEYEREEFARFRFVPFLKGVEKGKK